MLKSYLYLLEGLHYRKEEKRKRTSRLDRNVKHTIIKKHF